MEKLQNPERVKTLMVFYLVGKMRLSAEREHCCRHYTYDSAGDREYNNLGPSLSKIKNL